MGRYHRLHEEVVEAVADIKADMLQQLAAYESDRVNDDHLALTYGMYLGLSKALNRLEDAIEASAS